MRVLIDGDRRTDARGRGLSTYARTLSAALQSQGHEITWLVGAPASRNADPILDEVAVFDAPPAARGLRLQAQTLLRMATGLATSSVQARKVAVGHSVVQSSFSKHEDVQLAPNLFVHSHYRHMLIRQFTRVKTLDRFDVLHLTSPLPITMRGVRTVTTIHDLVPIRLPYTTTDNKVEFTARTRRCAKESDLILTVSEASRKDIIEILRIKPEKVAVTYQCSDLETLSESERSSLDLSLARFDLTARNYLLFVGAFEPKKNLRRMIEAFLESDVDIPLALVGQKAWLWESELGWIQESLPERQRRRLFFLGHVDRQHLRQLYAGATALLFPSIYEGFGLPVLEAMIMGCPVITSRTSSLPEVGGEAAAYVDPFDRSDIRTAIEQVASNASLQDQLRKAGQIQASKFSLSAYSARLAKAYESLSI